MGDFGVDMSKLPQDVREKLAELELELSEGKKPWVYFIVYIIQVVATLPSNRDWRV